MLKLYLPIDTFCLIVDNEHNMLLTIDFVLSDHIELMLKTSQLAVFIKPL